MAIGKLPRRLFALVAFVYGWLCVVSPFQHQECLLHDGAALAGVLLPHSGTPLSRPSDAAFAGQSNDASTCRAHAQVAAQQVKRRHAGTCAACEWQAMQVSAALPAFTFTPISPLRTRVVTTLPRYLPTPLTFSRSRAPPHA